MGCGVLVGSRNHVLDGCPHPFTGRSTVWWDILGMPKIAGGRYTQSYSQGAAAMRPLAVVSAATCNLRVMV